ncbi:DMT family transporter [Cohaesibacter haloalkalitolerans]|uniref:DMT family transporter n=1 Tax=Cohaesibacter haloalkalitolerans TaxID=1162980 RepID=UPI000E656AED|nr:DMT family transporter [Cohaesibacter haloalkalitolerans]
MRLSGPFYAMLAVTIFAAQDTITKVIGSSYSPVQITMVRYWAFALFAIVWALRSKKGFRQAIHTNHLWLQIARSFLLVGQIIISILSFAYVGLAMSQAIFAASPLVVAVLSVPLLGETVGWRRWLAIVIGMSGMMLIINPFGQELSPWLVMPVLCTLTLGFYNIMTRIAGRHDSAFVSFFYTGVIGLIVTSVVGPFFWAPITPVDWLWLGALCVTSVSGHYFLIKALALTEAVTVQTITYFQLVYELLIGYFIFTEDVTMVMLLGCVIVVAAGAFTIWREHAVKRANLKALKAAEAAAQPL